MQTSVATALPRPSTGFAAYRAQTYFSSLDGLRFICIMAVLWHHAPVWPDMQQPSPILTRGFLGVDFFFVLSGYLITTLLVREEDRHGRFSVRGFYWRRILRILPVYFLIVTALGVYYIFVKGEVGYLAQWPYYYLFLANFLTDHIPMLPPTWSLSVEEQFYMIWPLLLLVLPRRWMLPVLAVLIAINLAAVTGALAPFGIVPVDLGVLRFEMFTTTYAPILMGSALALLLHHARSFDVIARLLGRRVMPLVLFAALAVLIDLMPPQLAGWPNLVLHLTMTACLASLVVREDHVLRPVMTLRPVAWIGTISYGIYLYHLIALHIATVIAGPPDASSLPLLLFLYVGLTLAISGLSFRYFEEPILRFRRDRAH